MAGQNFAPKTSTSLIAVAWLIVILPAGWGLTHTVQNALKIFSKAPTTAVSRQPASPVIP